MSAANRWQKHFSQFLGIEFGEIVFRAEATQGIAHRVTGVGVAAAFNLPGDESL